MPVLKICFGKTGFIVIKEKPIIDCPNSHGGIGLISMRGSDNEIWTGNIHIWADQFEFQFSDIKRIYKIDTIQQFQNEEPWEILWRHPKAWSYQMYYDLATLIRRLYA